MLNGRELQAFRKQLLGWFREHQRDLPWRRTKDPYRIWLSEIMLQQTRVAAVLPYYERFVQRFPDIQTLATAPQEEVLRFWSGLGYYTRAPRCLFCPVAQFCRARKLGIAESLPMMRPKPATVNVQLAAAVCIDAQGRTLLVLPPQAKNGADGELAMLVSKMWHFPTIRFRKDPEKELRAFLQKKPWFRNQSE